MLPYGSETLISFKRKQQISAKEKGFKRGDKGKLQVKR
jgi:hypothetical protein